VKIVFTITIAPAAWEVGMSLLPKGFTIEVLDKDDAKRRIEQLESSDFLMGFLGKNRLWPAEYDHLGRIKFIQLLSAGYDGVDLKRLKQLGIPLSNNGGANSYAVSEHALMLMLMVLRQAPDLHNLVKAGKFKSSKFGEEEEHELAGKTVGIIGAGMIGRTLARRLSGFEVKLLYYDPIQLPPQTSAELNMNYRELDDLLRESDVVTLHAPSTEASRHMICERTLNLMKRDAIIINTARGELIDEGALYRALMEKRIWAAGLDAFEKEPIDPNNPLLTLPNVVLSPHSAGSTFESWEKRFGNAYANVQRVARGESPLWVVPELR
jgi:phosphoglycerate dehydrogenase-like enzyme